MMTGEWDLWNCEIVEFGDIKKGLYHPGTSSEMWWYILKTIDLQHLVFANYDDGWKFPLKTVCMVSSSAKLQKNAQHLACLSLFYTWLCFPFSSFQMWSFTFDKNFRITPDPKKKTQKPGPVLFYPAGPSSCFFLKNSTLVVELIGFGDKARWFVAIGLGHTASQWIMKVKNGFPS